MTMTGFFTMIPPGGWPPFVPSWTFMTDDEITVPADQPDPEYVDESPPAGPGEIDDPEPMQAGTDDAETDPEAETAAGTEPTNG